MPKLFAYICIFVGSACCGVGSMLLVSGMLPMEATVSILLGCSWLYISEILLAPELEASAKQFIIKWIRK